jgi:hypothetical protein
VAVRMPSLAAGLKMQRNSMRCFPEPTLVEYGQKRRCGITYHRGTHKNGTLPGIYQLFDLFTLFQRRTRIPKSFYKFKGISRYLTKSYVRKAVYISGSSDRRTRLEGGHNHAEKG